MLDPLTSLGLASNVVQLVTTTADLLSAARRLVQSSGDTSYDELQRLAEEHEAWTQRIVKDSAGSKPDSDDAAVRKLAKASAVEAGKLVAILRGLTVKSRDNGTKSFRSALWSVTRAKWKREEIEAHQKNLERYQQQLTTILVNIVRYVKL